MNKQENIAIARRGRPQGSFNKKRGVASVATQIRRSVAAINREKSKENVINFQTSMRNAVGKCKRTKEVLVFELSGSGISGSGKKKKIDSWCNDSMAKVTSVLLLMRCWNIVSMKQHHWQSHINPDENLKTIYEAKKVKNLVLCCNCVRGVFYIPFKIYPRIFNCMVEDDERRHKRHSRALNQFSGLSPFWMA